MSVLAINGGSSSIKFAVFALARPYRRLLSGQIEGIGGASAQLTVREGRARRDQTRRVRAPDHRAAAALVLQCVEEQTGGETLQAVGHRFVHSGPGGGQPQRLTPALFARLRRAVAMDPEHLPDEIALAQAAMERFRNLPHIACFDTAFHARLPMAARLLPIPRRYERQGIRRYGFHGLSYEYLMEELLRRAGPKSARGRIVLAHLGSGASLAAVLQGRPMDTTMAFTPAAGLPMATRSGDLDPGLAGYLARREGMTPARFNRMVTRESGLLGLSETSGDTRDLLRRESRDARAAEALEVFCRSVKKTIGAYAALLGGIDHLVFSGGIGEHSPELRQRICQGLDFLGLKIDKKKNRSGAARISSPRGGAAIHVVPTDEEAMIARNVRPFLAARGKGKGR